MIAAEMAADDLPCHLRTRARRWASLVALCVLSSLASGPIASWPTLEPILIAEGVFAGPRQKQSLNQVYSIAVGLAAVACVPAGILFDRLGPRFVGVFGALMTALSMVGVVVALRVPSLNWLLFVAFPSATLFGYMNLWCCYAYLWPVVILQSTVLD